MTGQARNPRFLMTANMFLHGLRRRFGLAREDYEAKLVAQGGVCAICGGAASKGKGNRFASDHDHRFPAEAK